MVIIKEYIFNSHYSKKWQEKPFLPRPSLRNIKMILNFIVAKIQYKLLMAKLLNYPYYALIDPSTVCNLHCPLCPTGMGETTRSRRLMKFEEFKRIIDEIGNYLTSVLFTNWGEPFLNKEFFKMIEYSKKVKQIPFLSVDTNLNVDFSDQNLKKLVESGLDLMCVSMDGASQKTYEKYRRGGSFSKVVNNSKKILEKRKELGRNRPFIIWQFLVFKHNQHEIEKAIEMARDNGVDALRISVAQVYMSEVDKPFEYSYKISEEYLPELGSEYSGYTKDGKRKEIIKRCQWLWKGIVINSDGGVSPCCAVFPSAQDFGNILKEDNFKSVWNNKKYQDARKAVKNFNYAKQLFNKKSFRKDDNVCVPCTVYGNWTG